MGMLDYRVLGRTGLRVAPFGLDVTTSGWGTDKAAARAMFDRYCAAGGNFIDTSDVHGGGESEAWLGEFVQSSGHRENVVLATHFSFAAEQSTNPSAGVGRKNIYRALTASLRRLRAEYVDLYIVHAWDRVTPLEEVMSTLSDLVRAGKVRHIGFSDVPAWYAARAQTLAELRNYERLAILQLEYSLVARGLEREHAQLAKELGISLVPWSPLAGGFLSGKYRRTGGRGFDRDADHAAIDRLAKRERNWDILERLLGVADELGKTPTEVALAWLLGRPQVGSVLISATKPDQLDLCLAALDLPLPKHLEQRLNEVSQLEPSELDHLLDSSVQNMLHGGITVRRGPIVAR